MRRLMPWREVTARERLNALPDTTRGWPAATAPGRERGSGSGRAPASLRCWRRSLSIPRISIQEQGDEVCRSRSVRRLCGADLGDDGGSVACAYCTAPCRGSFRFAAARLAPGPVCVRFLLDRARVHCSCCRAVRYAAVER